MPGRVTLLLLTIVGLLSVGGGIAESPAAEQQASRPSIKNTNVYGIGTTEAVLLGAVDPRGARTIWHFELGKTKKYGHRLPGTSYEDPLDGEVFNGVEEGVAGLDPGTIYHFRLVARNAVGKTVGQDQTFRTKGPRKKRG